MISSDVEQHEELRTKIASEAISNYKTNLPLHMPLSHSCGMHLCAYRTPHPYQSNISFSKVCYIVTSWARLEGNYENTYGILKPEK